MSRIRRQLDKTPYHMKHSSKIVLCAGILSAFGLFPSTGTAAAVATYNFNTDSDTEGWEAFSNPSGLSITTSGGYLTGTATNNDPQLRKTGVSITIGANETWDTLVFRVREFDDFAGKYIGSEGAPAFSASGLAVQLNGATPTNLTFTAVASGDNFYTVTADISGLAGTEITSLRVDPIGGALSSGSETTGNTFEVDFIQLNAVPEPGAAILGSLGMLALLRRRR
jgi:hypothetical protein